MRVYQLDDFRKELPQRKMAMRKRHSKITNSRKHQGIPMGFWVILLVSGIGFYMIPALAWWLEWFTTP